MRWHTLAVALFLFVAGGCATNRTVTITSTPTDAMLRIDGIDRGHGPVTEQFIFNSDADVHRVTANRLGFKDQTIELTRDYTKDTLQIEMKEQSRKIYVTVLPVAANVSIDGTPVGTDPVGVLSPELQFTVDSKGMWIPHTVTAERFGFQPKTIQVSWTDRDPNPVINMDRMRKDLSVTTTPPGANIYLDGQFLGTSGTTPLKDAAREFYADPDSNQWTPRKLRATKAGYDPVEKMISWDGGKGDYQLELVAKSKSIHILTDPAGAIVTLEGKELQRDTNGVSFVDKLEFPPDEKGQLRVYSGVAKKKTEDSEWEPLPFTISWDDGKTDYPIKLKEILTRPVALLEAVWTHADSGWEVAPHMRTTLSMKDVSEGPNGRTPALLTHLGKNVSVDTLDVSPDGSQILYTLLSGKDRANFHSKMMLVRTDGTGAADEVGVGGGDSLDLTPCFSPGGDQIAFASDRFGRRLAICAMALGGQAIRQLTSGDNNDLWPSIDSEPQPRLFYQSMVDTRTDPRLYEIQIGTTVRSDLTQAGGTQPRISPRDDSVLFCGVNQKSGKRDIMRVSDKGGVPENLTNSPDDDHYDGAWSKDGTKIAYVTERGGAPDAADLTPGNADIWVLDLKSPEKPVQITTNGSIDDHPVWDPTGNFIYFRSNRGGEWGIWKIAAR